MILILMRNDYLGIFFITILILPYFYFIKSVLAFILKSVPTQIRKKNPKKYRSLIRRRREYTLNGQI